MIIIILIWQLWLRDVSEEANSHLVTWWEDPGGQSVLKLRTCIHIRGLGEGTPACLQGMLRIHISVDIVHPPKVWLVTGFPSNLTPVKWHFQLNWWGKFPTKTRSDLKVALCACSCMGRFPKSWGWGVHLMAQQRNLNIVILKNPPTPLQDWIIVFFCFVYIADFSRRNGAATVSMQLLERWMGMLQTKVIHQCQVGLRSAAEIWFSLYLEK